MPEKLWTITETAKFLRVSPKTLQRWRREKVGPKFVQYGPKTVRYLPIRDAEKLAVGVA